ncbi:MAG: AAA family ATPase [Gemmatimonadales bacterium]|nr:AAA family ATPase [Gemmatimonadales bacterium]
MTRLVVASGKGGVGKSVVSVLLASAWAAAGWRALLVDADQNLANLHVLLGVRPRGRQEQLLRGLCRAEDLVQPVAERLWLLPGDSGAEALYALGEAERARLHARLTAGWEAYDVVVADSPPGLEGAVRVSALGADRLIVVITPEPAALTDAYALVKTVSQQLPELPIDILVNRADDAEDGRVAFEKLALATERFLRRGVRHLGSLPEDTAIRGAVRDPRRLLAELAASETARLVRLEILSRLDLPLVARSVA